MGFSFSVAWNFHAMKWSVPLGGGGFDLGELGADHERLDRRDDPLGHFQVLQAPEQLLNASAADGFDSDVDDGGAGREADEVGLFIVDRNQLGLSRTDV